MMLSIRFRLLFMSIPVVDQDASLAAVEEQSAGGQVVTELNLRDEDPDGSILWVPRHGCLFRCILSSFRHIRFSALVLVLRREGVLLFRRCQAGETFKATNFSVDIKGLETNFHASIVD